MINRHYGAIYGYCSFSVHYRLGRNKKCYFRKRKKALFRKQNLFCTAEKFFSFSAPFFAERIFVLRSVFIQIKTAIKRNPSAVCIRNRYKHTRETSSLPRMKYGYFKLLISKFSFRYANASKLPNAPVSLQQ